MNIKVLLAELQAIGIRLQAQDGKLSIQSSVSPIPAQALEKLKLHKASLLDYLEQVQRDQATPKRVLSAEEKAAGKEISTQQWALWSLHKLGKTANYNIPIAYDLRGQLDVHRLADALKAVYLASDALHSLFVERGEQVFMVPRNDENWCASVATGNEEDVRIQYQKEQQREFNIHGEPLFVAHIICLTHEHSVLILNFPHIVIDGWSIDVLWKRIAYAYQGKQFVDVQADFYSYLADEKPDHSVYWQHRLDNYEPAALHSVSSPNPSQNHLYYDVLPDRDLKLLKAHAEAAQVSVFSTALQCWGKALAKYLGQSEVVVSVPYANRTQWPSVIGYLVSMVPIRVKQAQTLSAFQKGLYQDLDSAQCDFNALLPSLGLQTEGGRHPLQQAVFAWQDGLTGSPMLADVSVVRREVELTRAKFPLSLSVLPHEQGYQLKWEFDPSILSLETIKVLQGLFLAQIRGESTPWAELTTPVNSDVNVVSLLAKQLDSSPTSIAVRKEDETLSYAQLWQQAQHVAAHLQALGVSPGEKIGVSLARDLNLSAAIVGIVLAGGAYVPMAVDESAARLVKLAELSQMRYCLSEALTIAGVEVCSVAEILSSPAQPYTAVTLSGQSPIYVNFTSGTTGEPKGILCVHEGVCRLVHEQDFMHLGPDTQMLCAAAQTFDAFTLEFWGPLLNGGCLHLLPEPQLDSDTLARMVQQDGINTLWLTAALFHNLVDINVFALVGVSQLLVGGDVVSPKHVKAVYEVDEQIEIINGYGPTENTTFTTCYNIDRDWTNDKTLPIGYSIRGTQVHILDAERQPVSPGCIGEIVVTGQGLAAGYLNKAQEVNRFITLPAPNQGMRAYCTGDIGYLDSEGRLRFTGRLDQQVKLRGYRIELTEIENVLNSLENIIESKVILHGSMQQKKLIAFYKSLEEAISPTEIQQKLKHKLPSYMLPNIILPIQQMPLTIHGKVDKSRLLNHYKQTLSLSCTEGRKLTEIEQSISRIWQDLLNVNSVPLDITFNRLGGHSLLSNSLKQRLQHEFGLQLSIQELYKYDTVQLQATLITQLSNEVEREKQSGVTLNGSEALLQLKRLAQEANVSGVSVSISRDHQYLGYNIGFSNIKQSIPMTRIAGFRITCINKFLIALMVLREVDNGRVGMDQDLRLSLPGGHQLQYPMTLTHLMTFSSGLDNSYLNLDVLKCKDLESVIEGLLSCGSLFEPGTSVAYGTEGTLILAWLLRLWTGKSWQENLAILFQELGLGSTIQLNAMAQGYQREAEGVEFSEIEYVRNVVLPDAIYDTVISSDVLVRFIYHMLFEHHTKLSDELIAQFKLRQVKMSDSYAYETCSLGCFVNQGRLVFMSDGTGHTNFISVDLDDQEIISVHVNLHKEANVIEQVATMLGHGFFLNKEIEQPPVDQFVGTYRSHNVKMVIKHDDGQIGFTYNGPISTHSIGTVSGKLNFQNQVGFLCENDDSRSSLGVCIPYSIGGEKYLRVNHYVLKTC